MGRGRHARKRRRNRVSPYCCPLGRPTARGAAGGAGKGMRRKRRPVCNGWDTGCNIARRESGQTSARSFMVRET
ncbi:hypothetical protein C9I56_31450 [Paraburkholderia caribensis]|nr:hypothetical protein C9I56_31450 [Paraburkholderia caribensis]